MNLLKTFVIIMAMCSATTACGRGNSSFDTVGVEEFADRINQDTTAVVVDVRTPDEYKGGHIDGATNIDWLNQDVFADGSRKLPKDSVIYVYCRSGARSAQAAEYLARKGYRVVNLDGGFMAWEGAGR